MVGAAGGIGRALVEALLEARCRVVALDLSSPLASASWSEDVARVPLDAASEPEVAAAFEALGHGLGALEGLVHLAGFASERAPVAETSAATWDEVTAGNLRGAFLCARAALPLLARGAEPAMVLTASGLAARAVPGYGPYAASKAGVLALTRSLAVEGAPGLRVNAVTPSAVDTPFLRGGTGRPSREPSLDPATYAATIPLGRLAEADDVVGPILFLLGPASRYMTGQTLHVNGGLLTP